MRENGLHADCFDFQTEVRRFMAEMDAGLCGGASTLQMAPTYLDTSADLPEDGDVVAVDAGGTNLRVALVRFRAGRPPEIVAKEKAPVPGSGIPVTLDEFFDRVVEQAGALLDEGDRLGMCFSFPSEILPDKDARILLFNKELRVAGAEGALIGPSLNAALARAGKGPRRVTVLNDTAAALLGELAMQQKRAYAGHIG
ncbi:MAG: hypothetical protein LBR00_03635, partial [Clostridiales Family XIII bacterium]|nr:hypothetical protein [Clostridiales Family XIII bacterium]